MRLPSRPRLMPWTPPAVAAVMAAVMAAIAGAARADGPPTTAPAAGDVVVTRTYDVADLVHDPLPPAEPPADPAAGGGGGGGGGGGAPPQGLFQRTTGGAPPAAAADVSGGPTATLVDLLQQSVDPGSWKAGGGTVAVRDDVLVVTQSPADQRAVADVLAGLRQAAGRSTMVRVDAQWLLLTPAEMAAGPAVPPPAATADNLYCQARAVGFNGQALAAYVQRATPVVTDVTPVVAPGVVTYSPTVGSAQSGVEVTVTPRLSADRDSARVDVESTVVAYVPRNDPPALPAGALAAVPTPTTRPDDRPPTETHMEGIRAVAAQPERVQQQVRTTVRLRPGVPTLVGGMSAQPGPAADHRSLCLVLTLFVTDDPAPAHPPGR